MNAFRLFGVFLVLTSFCLRSEASAARSSRHHGHKQGVVHQKTVRPPDPVITDSSSEAAWRRKLQWIYRDTNFSAYRDALLRPLFKLEEFGPGHLFKRGSFVEVTFPRGRPLHEYAFEVESLCVATGIHVVEGHEFDPPEEHVEYTLQSGSSPPLALRLLLGKAVKAGSAHMALVVVSLDSVNGSGAERLLAFPASLTLALAAGDSSPVAAHWMHLPEGKEALLELPMEPSNYPYLKPGPGALFIHHSRPELERLMQSRLKAYTTAKGFATKFGDRAIENRPLLENVFRFANQHSLVFLDLTRSPRSLTAQVALQTGAIAFSARIQEPDSGEKFEAEFLRRCDLAGKTGEGIWVLRYFPGLPRLLEQFLIKNQAHFDEIGLTWVPLSTLHRGKSTAFSTR